MSRKVAAGIDPGRRESGILRKTVCPKTLGSMYQERARIVLAAAGWIFVPDNLNTPISATLVYLTALLCNISFTESGEKGKRGILESQESRKKFLEDKSHRIRFVYTPKHCSWLNQIEIWFSGLGRRVLERGCFVSVKELNAKILDDITFCNQTAKPMK